MPPYLGQTAEAIKVREMALRWDGTWARHAQLAIRKVQVDLEVQANRRPDRTT